MIRMGLLTIVCLAFALFTYRQNKTIQITDLYGDWMLDLNEYDVDNDEYIFKRQKTTKPHKEETPIIISLLAFDECSVNYNTASYYCGSGTPKDYTWAFNEDLQIINIYNSEKLLKYIKEENPEEFETLGLPEKYLEMELSVLLLKNGSIGLKIMDWE